MTQWKDVTKDCILESGGIAIRIGDGPQPYIMDEDGLSTCYRLRKVTQPELSRLEEALVVEHDEECTRQIERLGL